MTENHLSPELVSLVHHIELNKSGWWNKAVRRMIVAAIWSASRPLSSQEVKEILYKDFQVELDMLSLENQIHVLRSEQVIVSTDEKKMVVAQNHLKEFEIAFTNSQEDAEKAKEQFCISLSSYCNELDPQKIWDEFNSNFLLPMIRTIGANTYHLVTGEASIQDGKYLDNFLKRYDESYTDCLRSALTEFFSPKNSFTRAYILKYLNVYFLIEATKISKETLSAIEKYQKKKPKFRLFLDTNFLFSVLGLHENPADSAAATLLTLSQSLKDTIDLRLYVIPDTIDEAKRVISSAINKSLTNNIIPRNIASAALHSNISGIVARYFYEAKQSQKQISPQEYFEPYINDLVTILKSKGIEVFGRSIQHLHTRQDVVDDILLQGEREQTKCDEKQKSYKVLQHDMTLWHVVNDTRPFTLESPLDAGDWVITLDHRLLGFDSYKQRVNTRKIPVCLHPTALIQLLQFWVPMSEDVQENILNSIRLPLIFHQFDTLDEAVTLTIVKSLSRYKDSSDLPESTVRAILVDKALRERLAEKLPENEQIQLIEEALINQHKIISDELIEERQRLAELDSNIRKKDQYVNQLTIENDNKQQEIIAHEENSKALSERVATLEKKEQLRNYKRYALYLPIVLLLISEWIIFKKLSSIDDNFKFQILSLFMSVFCIIWIFWSIRIGRGMEYVVKSKFYGWLEILAKFASWGLVFISTTIVGILIQNHWDQIFNWFNNALDAIGKTAV